MHPNLTTLIRLENGALRKRASNRRNLKTLALRFSTWTDSILKTELFENDDVSYDNLMISLPKFSSNICKSQMLRFQISPA